MQTYSLTSVDDEDYAAYGRAKRWALEQLAAVLNEEVPEQHDELLSMAILCAKHPDEALAWAVAATTAGGPLARAGGIQCIGIFGGDAVEHRSLVLAAQADPHAVVRIAADSVVRLIVEPPAPDPALQAAVRDAYEMSRFTRGNRGSADGSQPC